MYYDTNIDASLKATNLRLVACSIKDNIMGTYKKLKTNTDAFLKARFFGFSIFRKCLDIQCMNFAGSNESVYKDLGGGTQTKALTFYFTMPLPRSESLL